MWRIAGYTRAMLVSIVSIVVMIIGALIYALAANPKAAEMGRLMFGVGLFWAVAATASHSVHLL